MLSQGQDQAIERPKCIYYISDKCLNLKGVPLFNQCMLCSERIEKLNKYTIKHRFSNEKYQFHRISFSLKERDYFTEDDMFPNPVFNCLKKARFLDPEKKDKIKFNVFNFTKFEYYFEVFELELSELSDFIWYLEEFGYSDKLLLQFKENIIELQKEKGVASLNGKKIL